MGIKTVDKEGKNNMIYRKFGSSGKEISSLGFGCMRLPEYEKEGQWYIDEDKAIPMLHHAYENGVNYFDTAPYYLHKNSEDTVGKAMKEIRDKVMLSTKLPLEEVKTPEDYRRVLEKSLKKMDTDYIDFYHFWGINKTAFDEKIMGLNLMKEALKAKEEGLIRHISFSFHDKSEYIKYIIDKAEIMETMLVQYNLLDRSNEEMIAYAASKGLGVVIMGPVGGGRLATPALSEKLTGKSATATYELAFKFVLGNPNVSCALSGMGSMEMVKQNLIIAGEEKPLTKEEWEQLGTAVEQLKKFSDLYCTGCEYCQPCPKNIKIPHIFNIFTNHNVYGLTDHAKYEINRYLKEGGKTSLDCSDCGLCERKCPQKLEIRKQLKRVEKVLTSL
jgi:predicted aldo/keto reductase-like oxidoreductase